MGSRTSRCERHSSRCGRRWGALLGLWEILLETCPELGTPAIPGRPSRFRSHPDAAFRSTNGVGIATIKDFGAEPSRPVSLLCTLHTRQSPDEWQHSLPACSLALTGRDLHPLDFIKRFRLLHLWFLRLHTSPSAMVVLFIHFIATLARLLRPGGARSIVAESLLLKHQLLILNRSRQRARICPRRTGSLPAG